MISSLGISSWLGSSTSEQEQAQKSLEIVEESKSDSDDEFFDAIDDESKLDVVLEKELNELGEELIAQFGTSEQSSITFEESSHTPPMVEAQFILRNFSVSLVNNIGQHEGIELFSTNFTIQFMKYDSNSEAAPCLFTLIAKNEEFGTNQFMIIDHQIFRTSIIERETQNYMGEG